jgi:hypothetical protein
LKSNAIFPVAFAVCFPFAFILTRYMEDVHYVGKIGLATAVLAASTIAAIIAGLASVAFTRISRRRNRRSGSSHE